MAKSSFPLVFDTNAFLLGRVACHALQYLRVFIQLNFTGRNTIMNRYFPHIYYIAINEIN